MRGAWVRSGQTIEFPHGDVTVIGSVGSGAEIVAGGSIHVYGSLRGRAIAGCTGNGKARIFCRKFEAELIAIDGLYKTADDLGGKFLGWRPWNYDGGRRTRKATSAVGGELKRRERLSARLGDVRDGLVLGREGTDRLGCFRLLRADLVG